MRARVRAAHGLAGGRTLVARAEHDAELAAVHVLRVVAVEARLREALRGVGDRRVEVHLDRPESIDVSLHT